MPKFIDLKGKVFGKWTVLEQAGHDKRGQIQWMCECSCERKTKRIVKGGALTSGRSTCCGCERINQLIKNNKLRKKYNKYEILDENTMIGHSSNTDHIFYFDKEDFDKIKDYLWWWNDRGYMYTTSPFSEKRTNMYLHRFILDMVEDDSNFEIDHENRNRLDYRKSNLRVVESKNNNRNISRSFDNKSGFIGVDWMKRESKWRARIVYDGIAYHLGIFENKVDAIIARLRAELKYFGLDFAPQRHLFAEYGII